jgi:Leucine-rich repeat (LRR) protein
MIPGLLPPRSMEQAEQLSNAGQMLIPLLKQYWSQNAKYSAETIRAASLVGGAAALDLIANIVAQSLKEIDANRPEIRDEESPGGQTIANITKEAHRAWQYFQSSDYILQVLAPLNVTFLALSETSEISNIIDILQNVTSLEQLVIENIIGEVNLRPLAALPALYLIAFGGMKGSQLRGLAACHNIKELYLRGFPHLMDVEFPPAIEALDIGWLEGESLAGIEQWRTLIKVSLTNCSNLRDTNGLSELPNLKELTLHACDKTDITALALKPNLKIRKTQRGLLGRVRNSTTE